MTTFLPAATNVAALTARLTTSRRSPVVIDAPADRAGTLDAFAAALHFPDYFGRNLDALLDCLRDLDDDTLLIWNGAAGLRAADAAGYRGILTVLDQFQRERPSVSIFVIR